MGKMSVKVCKSAGFCFGVRTAVEKAYQLAEKSEAPVYSYGPIVHNEGVISDLQKKGVLIVETPEEFANLPKGTVIIRAHGISKKEEEFFSETRFTLLDATCPFVKRIHQIVRERSLLKDSILIIGDPKHPEVKGICGWCEGPYFVISSEEEIEKIPFSPGQPLTIVAQTTYFSEKFDKIIEILHNLGYNPYIVNTICHATRERQEEAADLAGQVDLMLVIGSKNSSNSQKLYQICKEHCDPTYFIESASDLRDEWFIGKKTVGITAGASTPKNII